MKLIQILNQLGRRSRVKIIAAIRGFFEVNEEGK